MTSDDDKTIRSSEVDVTIATYEARIAELSAQLEKERAAADDYMKRWQYGQAELANVRRRLTQERDDAAKFGNVALIRELVDILDHLYRAEATIPSSLRQLSWITGIVLVRGILEHALQQSGLEAIVVKAGDTFDPQIHQSINELFHQEITVGCVVEEAQRGYRFHGRLLRPSLVTLSRGKAEEESAVHSQMERDLGEQPTDPEGAP
ncbi:MAG: nucleotide exchange factor GrpE [Chloroflexi bacterium]|nr:nucleotide exchange factor GrpE [Chloroflexota bacterium]